MKSLANTKPEKHMCLTKRQAEILRLMADQDEDLV